MQNSKYTTSTRRVAATFLIIASAALAAPAAASASVPAPMPAPIEYSTGRHTLADIPIVDDASASKSAKYVTVERLMEYLQNRW